MIDRKFEWDGERIKETYIQEPKKHTTKDILNAISHIRGEIGKMENSLSQLEQQLDTTKKNLEGAREFEKELKTFEEKCLELQKDALVLIIAQIKDECIKKAKESSEKTIAAAPDAYTEAQKKQLPYLDYQKLLATNEKTSEKISSGIIRQFLYQTPIFDNPFMD